MVYFTIVCNLLDVLLADETTQPPSATIFKSSIVLPPTEPPFPSSRVGRPPSSKGKSRPSSRSSAHSLTMGRSSIGNIPEPRVAQTGFHRLQPLPAIGSSGRNVEDNGDSAVDLCSNGTSSLETKSLLSLSGHSCNSTNSCKSMKKTRKSSLDGHEKLVNDSNSSLPPEPSTDDPNCVTLAIKLPDGTRFERRFHHTDLIADIIHAAQCHSTQPLPDCELFTSDVPKKLLTDYRLTLREAGLSVRTMLILSEL